jgi:hypothetical protein
MLSSQTQSRTQTLVLIAAASNLHATLQRQVR